MWMGPCEIIKSAPHTKKLHTEFTDCEHLANLSVGSYQSSLREEKGYLSMKCSTGKAVSYRKDES